MKEYATIYRATNGKHNRFWFPELIGENYTRKPDNPKTRPIKIHHTEACELFDCPNCPFAKNCE